MKLLLLVVLGLICVSVGVNSFRVGAKECTWGPAYWCKNITNAKNCGAVKHCIQTDWIHKTLPPDNDDVCKICLEMVKEARDQLESNETQEELKEVFDGSCNLIPVKIVSKECCKLADDFIPELVETLASEMNPQVVCSVAGLCNNEWVDKQIEEMKNDVTVIVRDDCQGCKTVVDTLEDKMHTSSRDEILNNMLQACGQVGSLSDSCSAIIITYFNEIYGFLQSNLKSEGVCHIAGVCSDRFHSHRPQVKNVEVIHESNVGVMNPQNNLPCDLCEQLVIHLRDILVSNTTEEEFEQVLQGLCKQTSSFKDECLSLVNEYYAVIYNFLVNSLQPGEMCKMAGLCKSGNNEKGPIWPLLPTHAVETLKATNLGSSQQIIKTTLLTPAQPLNKVAATPLTDADSINAEKIPATTLTSASELPRVSLNNDATVVKAVKIEAAQPLPIDRMMPQTIVYVNNREVCEFCQYFLHYVQQAITAPEIEACDHLPQAIEGQCREFVQTYGNAFMALLAQEIDPSQICPKLGICPSEDKAVLLDIAHTVNDKPTCPLCLLALTSLVNKLKENKTVEEIKNELKHLCTDLPKSLVQECTDFVNEYMDQLVDMLVADFTPQEICTYLKLCDPTKKKITTTPIPEILSNEIPDYPVKKNKIAEKKKPLKDSSYCVICEFVMSKLDEELKDASTEDEIKTAVKTVCNYLPKTVATECDQFVDEYADLVIALLAQSLTPQEVCAAIKLCKSSKVNHPMLIANIKKSVRQCAVCEASMGALDELMSDPNVQKNIDGLLTKVCPMLPAQDVDECRAMINIYGPSILNLISTVADPRLVCMEIGVCSWQSQKVHLLGGKMCSWGPGYWCQSVAHAKGCDCRLLSTEGLESKETSELRSVGRRVNRVDIEFIFVTTVMVNLYYFISLFSCDYIVSTTGNLKTNHLFTVIGNYYHITI
ncbi:hypothetical protein C0J52_12679 [Blattella germanica]|nr:hypothetical protein C0J52_12679 [Blattella germanica]